MTITGRCLCGAVRWESSAPPIVTRVCWVQGVPIYRCRERNGQRLLPYSGIHGDRRDQRLSKCRGQWQPNAPPILSDLRDAALQ